MWMMPLRGTGRLAFGSARGQPRGQPVDNAARCPPPAHRPAHRLPALHPHAHRPESPDFFVCVGEWRWRGGATVLPQCCHTVGPVLIAGCGGRVKGLVRPAARRARTRPLDAARAPPASAGEQEKGEARPCSPSLTAASAGRAEGQRPFAQAAGRGAGNDAPGSRPGPRSTRRGSRRRRGNPGRGAPAKPPIPASKRDQERRDR